jgi:glycosyltransferase involved in cell wall biosynthesis
VTAVLDAATSRRIHLAIDAVGMRADSGGAVVLGDLLRAVVRQPDILRTTVFAGPELTRRLEVVGHPSLRFVSKAGRGRAALLWWNLRGLEERSRREGAQAIISLNGMGRARAVPIFVLFQQQLMFAPDALSRMGAAFRLRFALLGRLTKRACRAARLVFTQGEHVSENVVRHLGVPRERVCSIPPDITWIGAEAEAPPERDASLLAYVGSGQPHKSLDTLLSAFARLHQEQPELRLALTLSEATLPSAPGLMPLGRLERGAVRHLLQRASIMVMPSLAETVGLPLLEAFDAGASVVAADLPYAREVCGDAAVYFRPADAVDCAEKLASLLQNASLRDGLTAAGRRRLQERRARAPYDRLLRQLLGNLP